MPRVGLLGKQAGGSGPSYTTQGVVLDGTTTYLHRAGNFTGDTDGPLGIFSLWFNVTGGNGATSRALMRNVSSATVNVSLLSTNQLSVNLSAVGNSPAFTFASTATVLAGTGWHHLLAAWDTNHAAGLKIGQMYLDGINVRATPGDVGAAFNIDYTRGDTGIGAAANGINKFTGYMAELYFNDQEYVDISSLVNRYKWRGLTDHPADLGADGSTPTGNPPRLYIKGPSAAWATNLGTGGNLTVVGAFTDSPTNP